MSDPSTTSQSPWTLPVKLRFVMNIGIPLVFAAAAITALQWDLRASILPMTVAGIGLVLGLVNLIMDYRRFRSAGHVFVNADRGDVSKVADLEVEEVADVERTEIIMGLRYFVWILGYLLVMFVVGAQIGSALFLVIFFRLEGKQPWRFCLLGGLGAVIAIYAAEEFMQLRLPRNLLGL